MEGFRGKLEGKTKRWFVGEGWGKMVLKFGIDTRNPAIVVNNARLRKFIGFFENAIQQLHAFERLQLPNYKISNFRENKNGEK